MSVAEFQIRTMAEADVERVVAIAAAAITAPHWPRAAYLDALAPDASRLALVLDQGAELVGFAIARLLVPEAELESIAIAAPWRRREAATALMAALMAALRTHNVRQLMLEVRPSNVAARALYARLGFYEAGRRSKYYQFPEEDGLVLRKAL